MEKESKLVTSFHHVKRSNILSLIIDVNMLRFTHDTLTPFLTVLMRFVSMYLLQDSSNEIVIYFSLGNYSKQKSYELVFPLEEDYHLIDTQQFKSIREQVFKRIIDFVSADSKEVEARGSNMSFCLKKSVCYMNMWSLK